MSLQAYVADSISDEDFRVVHLEDILKFGPLVRGNGVRGHIIAVLVFGAWRSRCYIHFV